MNLLIDSNPEINAPALIIGQRVNIPGYVVETYPIQKGDTLWKLASSTKLSIDALLLLNQEMNPNRLIPGKLLNVPMRIRHPIIQGKRRYDSSLLTKDLKNLKQAYPFIQVNDIGNSVLGKSLYEIRVGKGSKRVHLNGSFHANEWITSSVLMTILDTYLFSLVNRQPIRGMNTQLLYDSTELSMVPMVNPDGVDLVINGPTIEKRDEIVSINDGNHEFTGWKANIHGVDLNNQYPAKWEIEKERKVPKGPASRDYPGGCPLTEPETVAMADLAKSSLFDRMLAFHTQGEEFYWGYEGLEPPESQALATEFERVSKYRGVQYVDSYAGYKDWFIQEFRRPGFTIELGKGINPLPLSQFEKIYGEALGIVIAALYM
jgi:g-D-glutamyl-meso-diaminopimelate peptidase